MIRTRNCSARPCCQRQQALKFSTAYLGVSDALTVHGHSTSPGLKFVESSKSFTRYYNAAVMSWKDDSRTAWTVYHQFAINVEIYMDSRSLLLVGSVRAQFTAGGNLQLRMWLHSRLVDLFKSVPPSPSVRPRYGLA